MEYTNIHAKAYYDLDLQSQALKIFAERRLIEKVRMTLFETLLDVGCGDGHFVRNFSEKETYGIDISKSMMELHFSRNLVRADIRNANEQFILGHNDYFDVITSNYVFMEMRDQEIIESFLNIRKMLKPTGVFYLVLTDPRTHGQEFPGLRRVFSEEYDYLKRGLRYQVLLENSYGEFLDVGIVDYHYPLEDYLVMIAQSGLKVENLEQIVHPNLDFSHAVLIEMRK